jgi:hypothetical protein
VETTDADFTSYAIGLIVDRLREVRAARPEAGVLPDLWSIAQDTLPWDHRLSRAGQDPFYAARYAYLRELAAPQGHKTPIATGIVALEALLARVQAREADPEEPF